MVSHRPPALRLASLWFATVALLAGAVTAPGARAAELDVNVTAYTSAKERGAVGSITGRASALAPKPSDPDRPIDGVDVVVMPRSSTLLSRLEEIKRMARASTEDYVDAVPEVQRAEQGLEAKLKMHEAGELVRRAKTKADGTFEIPDLPSGDWLLIASRSVSVTKHPRAPKPTTRREVFGPPSQLAGYANVTIWVEEVRVSPGTTGSVELTDRNPWLSGVAEKRQTPARKLRPLFD